MRADSSRTDRLDALLAQLPTDRPVEVAELRGWPEVVELYRHRRVRTLASDVAELAARGLVEVNDAGVRRLSEPEPASR